MRVFLTGGTGFIGQPLTAALRARNWDVTALVRKPDAAPARALVALGVTLAPGDVTERDSMRASMTGADLVIHNAGH
jgi:nucleoside-diphosphate-sugar epimerase